MDPSPWRMGHPVRIVHVFLQMTQNTFLAVVILNVPTVLYAHYATLVRPWGPSPIDDQRLAAGIMWLAGDLIFLTAIMVLVAGWMRAEGRDHGQGRPPGRGRPRPDPRPRAGAWPSDSPSERGDPRA